MKSAILIALALLFAPVAMLAACCAHRWAWPSATLALALLVLLILGAHVGLVW